MKLSEKIQKMKEDYALRLAVKQGLDTLPAAVCYFRPNGTIKLCNSAMYSLFRQMTQRDLQSYYELKEAMNNCEASAGIQHEGNLYHFPDRKVWAYSEEQVTTADGIVYTESVFNDVSNLYEKQKELKQQSVELQRMYRELKQLGDNIQDAAREQEIFNMKSLLHDQMNMGVTAIRQMLAHDGMTAENKEAIAQFRSAIRVLQQENAPPQDAVAEFMHDASVAGIQVIISGTLPTSQHELQLLLPVMREAAVNAARHADASRLYVNVEWKPEELVVQLRNDGRKPEKEVMPRGGLADLKKMIARSSGTMAVQSLPEFVLTVTLPVPYGKAEQGEKYDQGARD